MRIKFHEVVGFIILGLLMLAGIYVHVFDLHHVPEQSGSLGAQALMVGQAEESVEMRGVESVTIVYVSERDKKASTIEW